MKAFVIGGGMMVKETTPILVNYLKEEGYSVHDTEDVEELSDSMFWDCDLLVLNSCLWTGSKHTISAKARKSFIRYLETGKGVVAMHSSVGNWDDWPEYLDLVGGIWKWGQSRHSNPDSTFTIECTGNHPLLKEIPTSFDVIDEMYYKLELAEGNHIIARTSELFGGHPMIWHRKSRRSKVAAIMIGHDEQACSHPLYIQLFKNACRWTTRRNE